MQRTITLSGNDLVALNLQLTPEAARRLMMEFLSSDVREGGPCERLRELILDQEYDESFSTSQKHLLRALAARGGESELHEIAPDVWGSTVPPKETVRRAVQRLNRKLPGLAGLRCRFAGGELKIIFAKKNTS
jgi:hypothetical protein